ncbi:MAG: type II secretion system F family protein [Candidatus Levybacteria bacterium]|nr:type II secretion system F family protein [Candidatus Levybacteria bacterium]
MVNNEKITLKNSDKLSLLGNLSTMISAGIPILETIDSLLEDSKGNSKKVLEVVREDLIQGHHLYSSFARFPNVFDKVTVNVVRASEEAGSLDVTLKDLRAQIQKEIEFNDKVKAAMIYPAVIAVVFFGVLLLILVVVIPKISTVFSRLNVVLPLPTRLLIFLSNGLLDYTLPVLVGAIVIGTILFLIFKAQKSRILGFIYSLPLISNLIKEIDLARFSRSMFLLLTSGITITNALELAEEVVRRKDISAAIKYAKETVLGGKNLSQGFKDQKRVFSSIIVKVIEAGEKTGTLDKSMAEISAQQDYRVTNSLKTLTTLLEPVMLVAVGVLVGAVMLSIIAPIYGLIGQVSSR